MITIETIKKMVAELDDLCITDIRDCDTVNSIRSDAASLLTWSAIALKHAAHTLMDIRDREIEHQRRALLRDDELTQWVTELNGESND